MIARSKLELPVHRENGKLHPATLVPLRTFCAFTPVESIMVAKVRIGELPQAGPRTDAAPVAETPSQSQSPSRSPGERLSLCARSAVIM